MTVSTPKPLKREKDVKVIMWAVYNSNNSENPRAIFSRESEADNYHRGMKWGVTKRVELDCIQGEVVISLRMHEYRYIERMERGAKEVKEVQNEKTLS